MKILICEDDSLLQRALEVLLGKQGFEIVHAYDGNEAFEHLKKQNFDMLIVDIHLPYSNGIEIIEYYRHTLLKDNPIIIITAIDNKQIKEQAQELGVIEYIVKPFDPDKLVKTINSTLKPHHD